MAKGVNQLLKYKAHKPSITPISIIASSKRPGGEIEIGVNGERQAEIVEATSTAVLCGIASQADVDKRMLVVSRASRALSSICAAVPVPYFDISEELCCGGACRGI